MSNRSNRDLAEEALAYAIQLGVEVTTEGLKNPQLVELVAELKAKVDALPALPPEHKRPTVEEYVARGYNAEGYESAMLQWEAGIRRRLLAAEPPAPEPQTTPVDGTEAGPVGGTPSASPLAPDAPIVRPEAPSRRVDGATEGVLGGAPAVVSSTVPGQRYPYTVAEGKSVTSKRGMLGAFAPVSEDDFPGGADQLSQLVAQGYVSQNVTEDAKKS